MGSLMARIDLPYVHQYRDRHGKWRRYYRRGGFKVALPGEPDSAEFMEAYQAAVTKHAEGRARPAKRKVAPRSLDDLACRYYESTAFLSLRDTTKAVYRGEIERLRAEHGQDPVPLLRRAGVERLVSKKMATSGAEAANSLLRVLRLMLETALSLRWVEVNTARSVKKIRTKSSGFHSWTDAEIEVYEERWPAGSKQRLALALLLYTGQRRGDVVRMGRQHVADGMIFVRQSKTGKELHIPLLPALREALKTAPRDNMTYLMTAYGKPFTAAGFGNWFRDACNAAGLRHCTAHGLRKAAARRMAEADCTAHQIAAITGQSLQEVQRYTRAVEQKKLASAAVANLTRVSQKRGRKSLKDKGVK